MSVPYRPDVILMSAPPLTRTDDLELANTLLEAEGLGRPLGPPRTAGAQFAVIPTEVDPAVVRDTLKRVGPHGPEVARFALDYRHSPGTAGAMARRGSLDYYKAAGCQTGHGFSAWLPAPEYEMPAKPEWSNPLGRRRPVIALLDEGVTYHPYLETDGAGDPFVTCRWNPAEPVADSAEDGYRGHGTFNAGIIRFTAPAAQVLSMRVMSADGRVDESKLVEALLRVAQVRAQGEPVDVVCVPFGRYRDGDEDTLGLVKDALSKLNDIPVVASAGNDGAERPVYPAAFATEPKLSVVSVGSSESDTERAAYSNHGVWVKQWRGGTNVLSAMPMPDNPALFPRHGYAWWTGTSFAAVRYAAEIAKAMTVG